MMKPQKCGWRSNIVKEFKLNISFKWYELLLILIEAGLVLAGLWALFDSLSIGSPVAAWRFLLLFVIWALPGGMVLVFFRPKESE